MNLSCLLFEGILSANFNYMGASSRLAEHLKWHPITNIGIIGGVYSNLLYHIDIKWI